MRFRVFGSISHWLHGACLRSDFVAGVCPRKKRPTGEISHKVILHGKVSSDLTCEIVRFSAKEPCN